METVSSAIGLSLDKQLHVWLPIDWSVHVAIKYYWYFDARYFAILHCGFQMQSDYMVL